MQAKSGLKRQSWILPAWQAVVSSLSICPPPIPFLFLHSFPPPHPDAHLCVPMDHRGGEQRPPRSARPTSHSRSPAPPYPDPSPPLRPPIQPSESKAGVSFQTIEQGDRQAALDSNRARHLQSAYLPTLNNADPETSEQFDASRVGRKKSLVRPDREKIDPSHRQWHYRSHVAQMEQDGHATVGVMPSSESSAVSPGVHALINLFTLSSHQLRATTHNYDEVAPYWPVRRINTNQGLLFSAATHYGERNMHPRLQPRHRTHQKSSTRVAFGKAQGLVDLG